MKKVLFIIAAGVFLLLFLLGFNQEQIELWLSKLFARSPKNKNISVMDYPFIHRYKGADKEKFVQALERVANAVAWDVRWLCIVINNECGFNPKAVNPISGASGLIQFMPNTAIALGTTVEAIRKMSAIEQLVFVEKYLKPWRGKIKNVSDAYFVVFYPAAIGKPSTFVFPTIVAKQNKIFDLNKDVVLTKAEFEKYVNDKYGGMV